MNSIPDFLELPDVFVSETALRRTDLADLRFHVGRPEGIADGACHSRSGRMRCIAHGMLDCRPTASGQWRTFATAYGIEVARANASCIDGSEGLPPTPGQRREVDIELTARVNRIQSADHVVHGGLFIHTPSRAFFARPTTGAEPRQRSVDCGTMLARAIADTLASPTPDTSPLSMVSEQHGRGMSVGAMVIGWIRRRWLLQGWR
jgi:hypothetical protein